MSTVIIVGQVNEYPTIRRLADLQQTTVGYQQHVLTHEAVTCLYEVDILRSELASAKALLQSLRLLVPEDYRHIIDAAIRSNNA